MPTPALLRQHDVGLALMYTPHPSLVPIEMASAGMLTVTNSFENKTPAAMAEISTNLIACEPTIDGIADCAAEAAAAIGDYERRVRGSAVQLEPRLGPIVRRRAARPRLASWLECLSAGRRPRAGCG